MMKTLKNRAAFVAAYGEDFVCLMEAGKIPAGGTAQAYTDMGTVLTDIATTKTAALAVTMLSGDQTAAPLGQDLKELQQALIAKLDDAAILAKTIQNMLTA